MGELFIFMGFFYIYDNSDYEIYCNFFYYLKIKFFGIDIFRFVFSIDEEKVLVNVIMIIFLNFNYMLCKRYFY